MAANTNLPPLAAPMMPLRLQQADTVTATTASAVTMKAPFNCRIVAIHSGVTGIDDATDVDLQVEKGTTDLCTAVMAVADSSSVVSGGVEGTLTTTAADLTLDKGDVLHLDITVTGGSTPDIDGCWADVWVVRV